MYKISLSQYTLTVVVVDISVIVADPKIHLKNCMNDVFTSLTRWFTHYLLAK